MTNKYLIIFSTFILFFYQGNCCINEYRTLLNGNIIFAEAEYLGPRGRFDSNDTIELQKVLNHAFSIYKVSGKLEDYSDYGSALVYNGNYLKAKKVFQEIELKSPGLYNTAANLGTTYELLGENDSALYWIKKALALNPNSHNGSEWIHVKILEAKIKANGNEKYLWTHSILSLNFGKDKVPVNMDSIDLYNLDNQLYDQLNERMSFIKPKDPIIAQLLFDLGNIRAIGRNVKSGLEVYKYAEEYGYKSELLDTRKSYFEKLQQIADIKNHHTVGKAKHLVGQAKQYPLLQQLVILTCGVVLVGLLIYYYRRYKRRKKL
jgi:tetratricopeptide (TPR) repeat protein